MKRITDYNFESLGLERRIKRMFNEKSGRCLMLAVDHGYFQGAPRGFENLREAVHPLLPYVNCISPTRGGLKQIGSTSVAVILRATGGTSMSRPDELDDESVTVSIDEMLRYGVEGYSAQVMIGFPRQRQTIENLTTLIKEASKYDLIALGVNAVGKGKVNVLGKKVDLTKILSGEGGEPTKEESEKARYYLKNACRIIAENGATIVKTYYCEGFEEVVESCLVPIAMAGGKAQETYKMLQTGEKAIKAGVVAFDWGRNVIQNEHPVAMAVSLASLLHKDSTAKEAYEIYNEIAEAPEKAAFIYPSLII